MISRRILAAGLLLAAIAPALAQDRAPLQHSLFSLKATAAYPVRQDTHQWLGSNLIGAKVVSVTRERVGKVVNLVLNDRGTVEAAVIRVGGFMGFGGKNVAVTYDSLNIARNREGEVDHVTVAATRDDLRRAAEFRSLRRQIAEAPNR